MTTHQTADTEDNLSVKYENLFSINGQLTYLTIDENANPPYVNKWTNTYSWRPVVKIFSTEEDLIKYVKSFSDVEEIDLALLGDNIWYGNVGHALFDGFYPAYLAAVKFGFEKEPFVYLTDDWSNSKVIANEGIVLFSGNAVRSYQRLDTNKLIHFKTLISGTGRTGNRVINEEYKLYGSSYNALEKFKYRMLESCGAVPDKPINSFLKIVIINNKRYSSLERAAIDRVIEDYKMFYDVDITFLDWWHHQSFKEQMQIIQDVDIHITGPGTGMMYMPFLKKGAVNINLGYMEHTQTNGARPNIKIQNSTQSDHIFPGWMEQSVCAATSYVSTLYYDRFKYNTIQTGALIKLIDDAIDIVRQGKILENKHNIDARVFIEYCKRVSNARHLCDYLTGIAFFIELFVHEHPTTIPANLVNIDLLRQIKDELGMDRQYEIKL
jgi:hypothetical protein